ncbi:hypothetical protein RF11_14766 [Thelohanellus kitauei]|uniref:Uncharacterized protein n=1 Tax=Thelohanellus kitauei TaxID=669202 RepID=A0A0C2J3H3_THEKT|nr:hypothetical protein RF11_14766 [Thelohanellus kitauei]
MSTIIEYAHYNQIYMFQLSCSRAFFSRFSSSLDISVALINVSILALDCCRTVFLASIAFDAERPFSLQSSHDITYLGLFLKRFLPPSRFVYHKYVHKPGYLHIILPHTGYADLVWRMTHPVGVSSDVNALILKEIFPRFKGIDRYENKNRIGTPLDLYHCP